MPYYSQKVNTGKKKLSRRTARRSRRLEPILAGQELGSERRVVLERDLEVVPAGVGEAHELGRGHHPGHLTPLDQALDQHGALQTHSVGHLPERESGSLIDLDGPPGQAGEDTLELDLVDELRIEILLQELLEAHHRDIGVISQIVSFVFSLTTSGKTTPNPNRNLQNCQAKIKRRGLATPSKNLSDYIPQATSVPEIFKRQNPPISIFSPMVPLAS